MVTSPPLTSAVFLPIDIAVQDVKRIKVKTIEHSSDVRVIVNTDHHLPLELRMKPAIRL